MWSYAARMRDMRAAVLRAARDPDAVLAGKFGEALRELGRTLQNDPALKGVTIPRTGRQGRIGVLTTKTLVIAGEGGMVTTPSGQRGAMLRAYNKATGADAGAVYMPAPQSGSPMTYLLNGEQYLVVAISGAQYAGELLAFKLPRR